MSVFKEDLELQLERILEEVIRDIKAEVRPSQYQDHSRHKRDLDLLDKEIAELQVTLELPSKITDYKFAFKGLSLNSKQKYKLNTKKNCRCKREAGTHEIKEGRAMRSKTKKNKKSKQDRKSKVRGNEKKRKSVKNDAILKRKQVRKQRRMEKRLRKALEKNSNDFSPPSQYTHS